ncbi:MAG: hypothetical protein DRP09_13310 [Candidatus Thorarchaeota archaeon]|nr:MAG: hypothetical protein DRP09_13310 [Candidatus Thorarchaeota archaeon]
MLSINKSLVINFLPFIGIGLWIVGMFLPLSIGNLAMVGFVFGLALRVILPYYMAWKSNNELLTFNYAYLMPIVVLVVSAVMSGITGVTEYLTLVFDTTIPQLVYAGATVFAYGGYDAFNGFRKWWPFLEDLWEAREIELEDLIAAIQSGEVSDTLPEKEVEEPQEPATDGESEPVL